MAEEADRQVQPVEEASARARQAQPREPVVRASAQEEPEQATVGPLEEEPRLEQAVQALALAPGAREPQPVQELPREVQ